MNRLGRFELRGQLGKGGMATVWRAFDPLLQREVALKLLTAAPGTRRAERLLIEARAAATLDHPRVVRVHAVEQHEGKPYLVMDLIEGETLRARLARTGPLPIAEAATIVAELADALAAAHARGIAHRDLKPDNVLMDPARGPLLTDFGLARVEIDERLTATGELLGTPSYMAPEQLNGQVSQQGPPCDVHGLGILLHELLTGSRPYVAETFGALADELLRGDPPPPSQKRPEVDPALDAVCASCLRTRPADRPSAADVASVLRGWVAGRRQALPRRAGMSGAAFSALILAIGAAAAVVLVATGERQAVPLPVREVAVATPLTQLPAGLRAVAERPGLFALRPPQGDELELGWVAALESGLPCFIGREPVSWPDYAAFLAHTKLPLRAELKPLEQLRAREGEPAQLSWLEAVEYAAWAGARLPTREEWARAQPATEAQEWVAEGTAPHERWDGRAGRAALRLALDPVPRGAFPPLLAWRMEAVAFEPLPVERKTPDPYGHCGRSFDELAAAATRRWSFLLPAIDLRFGEAMRDVPPGFPKEWFSLRATTRVRLPAGRWAFVVHGSDDGVRVWFDGRQVIDVWQHGVWLVAKHPKRLTHVFELTAPREVPIRVEHVQQWGGARLQVGIEPR